MACFQVGRSGVSPLLARKSAVLRPDFSFPACGRRFPGMLNVRSRMKEGGGDNKESNGEEPPESLFTKELKRRGMNQSLLEDRVKRTGIEENLEEESNRDSAGRNSISAEYETSLTRQREQSMALNSEGLEGLIPRAKLLLTLGTTFFFGFWPLILSTGVFFTALYLYLGPVFVHDGSKYPATPPTYIDPYSLLEDERFSQPAPLIN